MTHEERARNWYMGVTVGKLALGDDTLAAEFAAVAKEARKQALEEAAARIERWALQLPESPYYMSAPKAIRALIEAEK